MLNTQWRQWLKRVSLNHSTGARRGAGRRRNRHVPGGFQPAMLRGTVETLEDRLLLTPSISAPVKAGVNVNGSLTFSTSNPITVMDPNAVGSSDNVSLGVSHGTLTLNNPSSVTFVNGTSNGSSGPNVRGTLAALNGALNGMKYAPAPDFTGSDTLTIEVFDSRDNLTGSATVAITVNRGYTPAQIRAAYNFNDITFEYTATIMIGGQTFHLPEFVPGDGRGQTIAIVEIGYDPSIEADANVFSTKYSLPALTTANFTSDILPGAPKDPRTGGDAGETALDVEWAHAIAPAAKILLVDTPFNLSVANELAIGASYAAVQPGVSVVSISYGSHGEFANESEFDVFYATPLPPQHAPVAFVAASGDSKPPSTPAPAMYSTISYPSVSPEVLAVGGTYFTKSLGTSGTHQYEEAWSESGGGVSSSEPELGYQNGDLVTTGPRTTPDVAYNAENYSYYNSYSGKGWGVTGGTSAGTPQWAALVAIADQGRALKGLQPLDDLPSRIAQLPSTDFHDITQGSNPVDGESAGPGYDLVTGYGTPVANRVVSDLLSSPFPPIQYVGGGSAAPQATSLGALGGSEVAAERTSPPQTADVPTTVPTSIGNVVRLASPAVGGMIPPSPAPTTGLGSNFATADAASPDSTSFPLTGDGANWLNDTESQWAGLSAALDVLNA